MTMYASDCFEEVHNYNQITRLLVPQEFDTPVFSISVGKGKAYGMPTSEGFLLLKGSSIHADAAESLSIGIRDKVEECRSKGEIKDSVLMNDKLFSSSTAAAAFAVGYSISGPQQWKTEKGETLKMYESRDS